MSVAVVLEAGSKRVFASALDWPGWSRSAKDEAGALGCLDAYAGRYAVVARRACVRFPASAAARAFTVVERLAGSATTDFGAPAAVAAADWDPLSRATARRLADLLEAAWATLDEIAKGAPAVLRKGPRGGGRDRDTIVEHVQSAESAYVRKIGLRLAAPARSAAVAEFRSEIVAALRDPGSIPPPGPRTKPWPLPYFVRRAAWHVLDHAWEIEDRAEGG